MPFVEMICLANSRKHGGHCVAGLRADGGGWIRPVSSAPDGTLRPGDYCMAGGEHLHVLDHVRLFVRSPRPEPHQPENWLVGNRPWELLRRPAARALLNLLPARVAAGPDLFGDCRRSMDCAQLACRPACASLCLVRPIDLAWRVAAGVSGGKQARACFRLARVEYDLPLTDFEVAPRLFRLPLGSYNRSAAGILSTDDVLLTISLTEPFAGRCYKLVAAVVAHRRETMPIPF